MLERMWSEENTHPLLGMQTCATTLEINVVVSQKTGSQPTSGPAIPLLAIYPEDAQSYYKSICSTMFIAALFVIARTWKQPRCPSTEVWIKKVWHIYTLACYSLVKSNDIFNCAYKWMELENTILSEVTKTPKKWIWYVLTHKWILAINKRHWAYFSWS